MIIRYNSIVMICSQIPDMNFSRGRDNLMIDARRKLHAVTVISGPAISFKLTCAIICVAR